MKNSWIIPVATLAIGAAGGYISGKGPGGSSSATSAESAPTRTSSRGSSSLAESAPKKSNRVNGVGEISRLAGNSNRIQALLDFYSGLTPAQLEEEAGKLDALPMNERIMASILLFGRWAEVDAQAAMSFSNTMGFAGGFVRPTILQSWSSKDPASAAAYYEKNPREFAMMGMMGGGRGPMGGQGGASIIASEWARQDPTAAMAWASGLSTAEKGQAMSSVVSELAKTDPRAAAGMITQMDAGDQAGAYRSVASQYGAMNFADAKTWVDTLPADQRAAALASAVQGLATTNPAEAAKQFALMPESDEKNRVIDNIVGSLAKTDPAGAAKFLKSQDSEDAQRNGMRELLPTWASQDPTAALAFVNSYQSGPVRDSAAQAYVWGNTMGEPADLMKVAETITDEGDRNRTIAIAAMRWMREDPAAARDYIESSSGLSDDAKERITSGRGMWGGGGRGRGR